MRGDTLASGSAALRGAIGGATPLPDLRGSVDAGVLPLVVRTSPSVGAGAADEGGGERRAPATGEATSEEDFLSANGCDGTGAADSSRGDSVPLERAWGRGLGAGMGGADEGGG